MKHLKRVSSLLTLILLFAVCNPAAAQHDAFVNVDGNQFKIDGNPYFFIGFNYWYGMNLGADHASGDYERLVRELDQLESLGVDNLRVLAASEGPDDAPWRAVPSVQPRPGEYNENVLKGLDVLLDEMAKRDMRASLILNNFFQWSGGMAQYVNWATGDPIPYPHEEEHSWNDFQKYSARFYSLPEAIELHNDYIRMLTSRENTVNGKVYSEDPTIMSWELGNEPRLFGAPEEDYRTWVKETAGLIQREAPNQLVAHGGEGKTNPMEEDLQFGGLGKIDELDYLTIHLWIENWQIYDPANPEETFDEALGFAGGYVANHLAIAEQYNKPLVLEEFGISRDGGDTDPSAAVQYRNTYYTMLFRQFEHLVRQGTALAGYNVWSYGGEGRPVEAGGFWSPGDPFTGDPPHESQGWYSIYDTDDSTLRLFKTYNERLDEIMAE